MLIIQSFPCPKNEVLKMFGRGILIVLYQYFGGVETVPKKRTGPQFDYE